jgi:hypothetical protein
MDKILRAFDYATNIILDKVDEVWFVIDANKAEPEVNWPGELLSHSEGMRYEDAKEVQRQHRAKILIAAMGLTEQQYLLIQLAEECAEVTQRVCKALRFGMDEVQPGQELDNAERIDQEFTDLLTVHDELVERCELLPQQPCKAKREKIAKYMDYSREQGVLVPA